MKKIFASFGLIFAIVVPMTIVVGCASSTDEPNHKIQNPEPVPNDETKIKDDITQPVPNDETKIKDDITQPETNEEENITPTIKTIADAATKTKIYGKSSQYVEYVTDDQIKDLFRTSLDTALPQAAKINIIDRENSNFLGAISLIMTFEWDGQTTEQLPIVITKFARLDHRNTSYKKTLANNPKLEKAYRMLYRATHFNGDWHLSINTPNVSDILPSEYAKKYRTSDFETFFAHKTSFLHWVKKMAKIFNIKYNGELDDVRITGEVAGAVNSKGRLKLALYIHDDKTKETVGALSTYMHSFFYVQGFAKGEDEPEINNIDNFTRVTTPGIIVVTNSKK